MGMTRDVARKYIPNSIINAGYKYYTRVADTVLKQLAAERYYACTLLATLLCTVHKASTIMIATAAWLQHLGFKKETSTIRK